MAGIKQLKRVGTTNPDLQKLEGNLKEFVEPILHSAIIDGFLLTNVKLVSGQDNAINHGLGRELHGWLPIRVRAQATIWDTQDTNKFPSKTLILQTSANVTVDLWVF